MHTKVVSYQSKTGLIAGSHHPILTGKKTLWTEVEGNYWLLTWF